MEEKMVKELKEENTLRPEEFTEVDSTTEVTDKPHEEEIQETKLEVPTMSEEELEVKKHNSEQAKKRREREAKEKAERERLAREEEIRKKAIEEAELGILKTNPYNGKPINDTYDLEQYKVMKGIEDKGGDPVADYPDEIARIKRENDIRVKKDTEERAKVDEQLKQEVKDLRKKYPEVNTVELAEDELFQKIADEKGGRWTITEIYEETVRRKGVTKADKPIETPKVDSVENITTKSVKQPTSTNRAEIDTKSDIQKMTKKEFEEYWRKKYGG